MGSADGLKWALAIVVSATLYSIVHFVLLIRCYANDRILPDTKPEAA